MLTTQTNKETEKFKTEHDLGFSITREEVADKIRGIGDPDVGVIERPQRPWLPTSLRCGGKTYALLYGTDKGVAMVVRITDRYAEELAKIRPGVRRARFPRGANWYYIPAFGAFGNRKPVYRTLDAARAFVSQRNVCNPSFSITRKEIADGARGTGDPGVRVIERPRRPWLPTSLRCGGKTYAMLYGAENGVAMVVRITDRYAGELAEIHPGIRRARFPRGADWYCIPIDGTFNNKESVYRVLDAARGFVAQKSAARPAVRPAAQKAAALKAGNTAETRIRRSRPR